MTAVEWLVQQICGEHTDAWKKEIEQANELFEQQIKYAYAKGNLDGLVEEIFDEEYYNETYKPST